MSAVQPDFVKAIAEVLGISVTDEGLRSLSLDVDYKLRQIIQEASKVARRSRRICIKPDDINQSFRNLNVEPTYGLCNTSDPFRFVKVSGHAQILRTYDPVLPLSSVLAQELPPPPWEAGLRLHWLAIDGRQPKIPENIPMIPPDSRPKRQKLNPLLPEAEGRPRRATDLASQQTGGPSGGGGGLTTGEGILVKAPLKHVLSKEMNLYLDKVKKVISTTSRDAAGMRALRAVLLSLRMDSGLQPLAPYLCTMLSSSIWEECHRDSRKSQHGEKYQPHRLQALLNATECIASNRTLDLSWYLHELIPSLLEVLLGTEDFHIDSRLTKEQRARERMRRNRWDQRDHAARTLAAVCVWYPEVAARIQRKMVTHIQVHQVKGVLPGIYGAIVGLGELGDRAVQTLLLPNFVPLIIQITSQSASCEVNDLFRVKSALMASTGRALCGDLTSVATEYLHQRAFRAIKSGPRISLTPAAHTKSEVVEANGKSVSEVFLNGEDPCVTFSTSEQSIQHARMWLVSATSGLGKMHGMIPTGYDHAIKVSKAREGPEFSHATASSNKLHLRDEVFSPDLAQPSSYDEQATMLRKSYEHDACFPAYKIANMVFGEQSWPFMYRIDDTSSVFV